MRWTRDVERGAPVEAREVGLDHDAVELYVEASPSPEWARGACALRIQVLREGLVYADETLWSAGEGAPVRGRLPLVLRPRLDALDRGLSRTEE